MGLLSSMGTPCFSCTQAWNAHMSPAKEPVLGQTHHWVPGLVQGHHEPKASAVLSRHSQALGSCPSQPRPQSWLLR